MTVSVKLDLPEGAFSALKLDPEGMAKEIRLAAAVKWFEMGKISQEKAAEIAGLSRTEFVFSLAGFSVSPVQYTVQEIQEELDGA